MRRVEELQQQILTVSRAEFAELRAWFLEHDSIDRLHAELHLSPEERAELDRALDAHEADRDAGRIADAEWLKEAKDRLAGYHSGDLPAIDAEQVFNELGKRT